MGRHVEAGSPGFPTVRVGDVKPLDKSSGDWLVEGLWSWRGVGVLGGPPKSTKTWAAVDLALSVASGTKAFEVFPVPKPGPVVFFAAEDAPPRIRERFAAISERRGLALEDVDVHLLDVPSLRLDDARSQLRLLHTLRSLRPRLLVLDPLVRLHSGDENSAADVSGLLSFLRSVERELETAVLLVHHTRKDLAVNAAPGQGLRGSSDLWAWGDSNLYLRRARSDRILLTVEHRSAPSPAPVALTLVPDPQPHLEVAIEKDEEAGITPEKPSLNDEILSEIRNSPEPIRLADLRGRLHVRKQRLVEALRELSESGLVARSGDGFVQKQLSFE
jgi:hypothetical protein